MADDVNVYGVLTEGFLFGDWHDAGDTIRLTARQARRFVEEGRIALPEKAAPPPPDDAEMAG